MKIRQYNIDIVHAHICTEPFFPIFASLFSIIRDKPLILTCHVDVGKYRNDVPYKYKIASKFHKYLIDIIYSNADTIIRPSEQFAKESKLTRKHVNKITTIPNGINLGYPDIPYSKEDCRKKLQLSDTKIIILFVGNPHPNKGADVLIKAMPKILQKTSDIELIFVGEGLMKETLRNLCMKLNVSNYVKFTGFVSDIVKKMYYKSSDIFVLPSFFDTFGIVLLEASTFGLPLVVSNIEPFKDIIENNSNGMVTILGDEIDLAQKITYLVENEEIRAKFGKNALERVKDFSWEKIAWETEICYNNVVRS